MDRDEVDQYGHKLVDNGKESLERRINRKAVRYAKIRDGEGNAARKLALRAELLTLCLHYFRVVGQGMSKRDAYDDVLVNELYWCLDHFDSAKGLFTHLLRFRYKRQSATAADREYKVASTIEPFDEEEHLSGATEDQLSFEDSSHEQADAMLAEFISLVVEFLDHLPDRKHNERAKLYLRMNFTEWTTYSVKIQPVIDGCELFESQETRFFSTMELPFLDAFMAESCRSIRKLWKCELKEGMGTILRLDDPALQKKNPPAPWKLPISVHADYVSSKGYKVTSAVISQHRKKFELLKEQMSNRLDDGAQLRE
ncbi:MAG: hypothetical protein IKG11_01165 [Atopobiaceae bacterium]|nr:hypothetical protein [Atopobiaceae bacterium]